MLLVESEGSRIGGKYGEGGGVGRPYLAVKRGRRDGVFGFFGREAISAHDIGFFGVAGGVIAVVGGVTGAGKAGGSIEIAESGEGEIGDTSAEGAGGGEAGGVGGVAMVAAGGVVGVGGGEGFFDFLQCLVRTCSCSLVLLGYFSGHRLQANASAFFFAIRASSSRRCCNR